MTEPPNAIRELVRVVQESMQRCELGGSGSRILLGLSGGLDSMVLLRVLAQLASGMGWQLLAATVDHGVRPFDAEREAVARACRTLGVPLEVLTLPEGLTQRGAQAGTSYEEQARIERHGALMACRDRLGASCLALAHHREDQGETVLMRLGRGTGLWGLSGIREWTAGGVWRPLLAVPRGTLRLAAGDWQVSFVEDPTNADPAILRNWVRNEALPFLESRMPGIGANLARCAHLAGEELELLQELLATRLQQAVISVEPSRACLDTEALGSGALRRVLLHRVFIHMGAYAPGYRHFQAMDALLDGDHGTRWQSLPRGMRARREYNRLTIELTGTRKPGAWDAVSLQVPGETAFPGGTLYCQFEDMWSGLHTDAFELLVPVGLVGRLLVRPYARGDRLRPLGMEGERLVSDVLGEGRVPRDCRAVYPVLVDDRDQVIWIPGLKRSALHALVPGQSAVRVRFQWNDQQGGVDDSDR
jgi:tRNA(Ile)-lysidine synthase